MNREETNNLSEINVKGVIEKALNAMNFPAQQAARYQIGNSFFLRPQQAAGN
jgi:hypothetical protein